MLNWEWSDRMGEITYTNGHKANLYQGNAYVIAVHEEDKQYLLEWFAADKEHMRNMLGITKGHDNVFKDFGIAKFKLNTRYKSVPGIVQDFAKAKLNVTIELYYEGASK